MEKFLYKNVYLSSRLAYVSIYGSMEEKKCLFVQKLPVSFIVYILFFLP